jgi:hypothetical protein
VTDDQEWDSDQEAAWEALYSGINAIMREYGKESHVGTGDYWVVDDNYGNPDSKILIFNLGLLRKTIVTRLQGLLASYPRWEIIVAVDVPTIGDRWPRMGLIIRADEVIDALQRDYFPSEYRNIEPLGTKG